MKLLLVLGAAAAAAISVPCGLFECCSDPDSSAASGRYVEARTAAVFAGACHYNGEYMTAGREAVLAWRFDGGTCAGVQLADLCVVAVVTADDNLAEADAQRRSVVYVPADATERERDALETWVRVEHAAALGEVQAVETAPIFFARDTEGFGVIVGDGITLTGTLMPNRECCTMPFCVWYEPHQELQKAMVGRVDEFSCEEERFERSWSIADENCVFLGAFGPTVDV